MEHQKVSPTPSKSARSIGWRVLLAALALVGMWNFWGGVGRSQAFRPDLGWSWYLWWVWPYVALAVAWSAVAVFAVKRPLRQAFILTLVVLVLTLLMLRYDVAHPRSRAQIWGKTLPAYYSFWIPWAKWGWNVQEPVGARGCLFGDWCQYVEHPMYPPRHSHSQPSSSSQAR